MKKTILLLFFIFISTLYSNDELWIDNDTEMNLSVIETVYRNAPFEKIIIANVVSELSDLGLIKKRQFYNYIMRTTNNLKSKSIKNTKNFTNIAFNNNRYYLTNKNKCNKYKDWVYSLTDYWRYLYFKNIKKEKNKTEKQIINDILK